MRRHQTHKGQLIFINTLKETDLAIGVNSEMKDMIGTYIRVHGFADFYSEAITVIHPKSMERYTIHCKDISLEPKMKKGARKIIKFEKSIKGRFDVNALNV